MQCRLPKCRPYCLGCNVLRLVDVPEVEYHRIVGGADYNMCIVNATVQASGGCELETGQAITVTSWWVRWRLKSPASRLFTQPLIQAQIKESTKAPRHWPLCGEFTGDRWIPRTNGQ